ncbi:hypothetical protein C8Q73DRAFT_404442 [Cubamyces lactineus]|nr:hypothetical protein C8Q73DRAFT_404442 [Cubamyces lactineus]
MADQDQRITNNVDSAELEEHRTRLDDLREQTRSLQHKLVRQREKHDRIAEAIAQLTQAIDETRQQANNIKTKHTEERHRLEILQAELHDRQANFEFDPLRFLRDSQSDSSGENAASDAISIPSASLTFTLPKAAADRCTPGGYLKKSRDEVVWPKESSTKSHFLSLATTHRYNPKLNNAGGWEPMWDMEHRNGSRDFFYMEDKTWHYLGTYEYVGQAILPSGEIKGLLRPHMHYLRKRAFLFPDMLPPALTSIAEGMFDGGALKVTCTGWRRVGFNDRLAETIRGGLDETAGSNSVQSRSGGKGIPIRVPKEGSRIVRETVAQDEDSSTEGRPRKKQKKADRKEHTKAGQKAQRAKQKAQQKAKQKARQKTKQKTH